MRGVQESIYQGNHDMTRRRNTRTADMLLDLISRLPWWAGIALAIASYLLMHTLAKQPLIVNTQPGQLGPSVVGVMLKSLAAGLQYILPLICLLGAGISAWQRRESRQLARDVAAHSRVSALDGMTWQQFERLVGEGFRMQGYRVSEIGGGGADGGVDIVLTKGTEKFLVQCKQWRAMKVGVQIVRELYGVMAARGATGGFVVTSGSFTDEAAAFARGRHIELMDGPRLHALLREVQQPPARTEANSARDSKPASQPARVVADVPPDCPNCGRTMVKRTAKRGEKTGSEFWGCPAYPACRGTRPAR